MQKSRRSRWSLGFTLTEIAVVTALVSSVPAASYVRAKKKAYQTQCANNLMNIGRMLMMYQLENDCYPKAAFYPKDPAKGQDSIRVILGGDPRLWICPGLPKKIQQKGLSFVYNTNIAGKRNLRNPHKKWVLIEVNCVSKKAPPPHPGGYNILFADGHVIASKVLPRRIMGIQRAQIRRLEKQFQEMYAQAE